MPIPAANPAVFPHQSSYMVEQANTSPLKRNGNDRRRSSYGVLAHSDEAAMARSFRSLDADENCVPVVVSPHHSRLMLGHRFRAFHAPCGNSLFCFGCAALRVTVSLQILFGKSAEKIYPEPP